MTFDELKEALAAHTIDVLQALKDEGIEPKWVQVGNETSSGMVWEDGRIDWNKPDSQRWLNYVALSNTGYDAVKSVLPNAYVIVHHDNAVHDNEWFYQAFQRYGGKFDMIGLSHYPDWEQWCATNTTAAANLRKLYKAFHVPVMIVETGYSTWDEPRAEQVMKDLFEKMTQEEGCVGILYWEPEVYGGWDARLLLEDGTWRPGTNGTYGLKVVNNGAFTACGQPAPALLVFGSFTDGHGGVPTGDANSDGQVDIEDANVIINIMLGKADSEHYPAADANGDGWVDVEDLNIVINIMLEN